MNRGWGSTVGKKLESGERSRAREEFMAHGEPRAWPLGNQQPGRWGTTGLGVDSRGGGGPRHLGRALADLALRSRRLQQRPTPDGGVGLAALRALLWPEAPRPLAVKSMAPDPSAGTRPRRG